MLPGLPHFRHSSASMYYCQCKLKNEKWGRPGNEATHNVCDIVWVTHSFDFYLLLLPLAPFPRLSHSYEEALQALADSEAKKETVDKELRLVSSMRMCVLFPGTLWKSLVLIASN